MDKKIIVAGHVSLDITPVFPSENSYMNVADCFLPGTLINVEGAVISPGGVVSNTGLALRKMGADVSLIGKTGNDNFGRTLRGLYADKGADGLLCCDGATTSFTMILAAPGIDRIFLYCPGANDTFVSDDISDEALEGAALFHFGYPPLMRSMYEDGGAELVRLFRRIKEKGILTSLDMAAVDPNGDCAKTDWRRVLEDVLPYVDYFEPSLEEILCMLGPDCRTAEQAAEECFALGAKTVLIKCGADGLYYRSAGCRGHQSAFEVPFVASATGAGDTCIAAFLYSILDGRSVTESVRYAAAQGACCVTAYDTVSGLKTMDELEEMIKNAG